MGGSRHRTRERQENYFGIESMISALCLLCPGKFGFAHTRGGGGWNNYGGPLRSIALLNVY